MKKLAMKLKESKKEYIWEGSEGINGRGDYLIIF